MHECYNINISLVYVLIATYVEINCIRVWISVLVAYAERPNCAICID